MNIRMLLTISKKSQDGQNFKEDQEHNWAKKKFTIHNKP